MTYLSQIASRLRGRRSRKRTRRAARPQCDVRYQLEALEQICLLSTSAPITVTLDLTKTDFPPPRDHALDPPVQPLVGDPQRGRPELDGQRQGQRHCHEHLRQPD